MNSMTCIRSESEVYRLGSAGSNNSADSSVLVGEGVDGFRISGLTESIESLFHGGLYSAVFVGLGGFHEARVFREERVDVVALVLLVRGGMRDAEVPAAGGAAASRRSRGGGDARARRASPPIIVALDPSRRLGGPRRRDERRGDARGDASPRAMSASPSLLLPPGVSAPRCRGGRRGRGRREGHPSDEQRYL